MTGPQIKDLNNTPAGTQYVPQGGEQLYTHAPQQPGMPDSYYSEAGLGPHADTARQDAVGQGRLNDYVSTDHQQQARWDTCSPPPPPRMTTFDGSTNTWRTFIFQFKAVAEMYSWDSTIKRERLISCLSGKAVACIERRPQKLYQV